MANPYDTPAEANARANCPTACPRCGDEDIFCGCGDDLEPWTFPNGDYVMTCERCGSVAIDGETHKEIQ